MRLLLQRVSQAEVRVAGRRVGACGPGLVIFVGVGHEDSDSTAEAMARRTAGLRMFRDGAGLTNLSLLEVGGQALVVSQFTLYADTRAGRRPSFLGAARPEAGERLYERFASALEGLGVTVGRGTFGAEMEVELVDDGPFTIFLDSAAR